MIRFEYSSNGPGRIYKGHERAYSRGREAYIWGGGLLFRGLGRVCIVLRPLNKKLGSPARLHQLLRPGSPKISAHDK